MASVITGTQAGTGAYTGLNEAMKIVFDDPINNNIIQDSEVYDLVERDTDIPVKETTGGRYVELAHYAADGGGFGARREGGALPAATPPSIFNGRIFLRKNHMLVEMSGEAMRRMKRGDGAWIAWASQALPNAVRRLTHHLDRQTLGYAQGVLGRVNAIAGGRLIITVDRAFGVTGYSKAVFQFLRNDLIRFAADINGVTMRVGAYRVLNVDNNAGTITLDAAADAGIVVGDFITIGDSADNNLPGSASLQPKEMMGLMGMVDNGSIRSTFQNVDRALWPEYNAQVLDAASASTVAGQLNEDLLTLADDNTFELGMGLVDFLIGTRAQERQYVRTLRTQRRLVDAMSYQNQGGKKRGFDINLNGRTVTFRPARKIPNEILFGIERKTLKKWRNGNGFQWDDTTGSMFERVVTSQGRFDAFYATGLLEEEMGNLMPAHNFVIRGINVNA
jgi:hypothetical protein